MKNGQRTETRGFTLVELLVVVSIIALLIAILLPSLKRAREQSKDVVCKSNMKQLGVANGYYSGDNQDRFLYIERKSGTSTPGTRPYLQYQQLLRLVPYLKQFEVYICPKAKGGSVNSFGWNPVIQKPSGGPPNSVKGWETWSVYRVMVNDSDFRALYKRGEFSKYSQNDIQDAMRFNGGLLDDLYTEYWVNDWGAGAIDPETGREIPQISGGLVGRIPYPNYAVVMADAVRWNLRHRDGSHFLFVDTHVDQIKGENYYDPKGRTGTEAPDKDPFGNYPHWSWGLGKNIEGR